MYKRCWWSVYSRTFFDDYHIKFDSCDVVSQNCRVNEMVFCKQMRYICSRMVAQHHLAMFQDSIWRSFGRYWYDIAIPVHQYSLVRWKRSGTHVSHIALTPTSKQLLYILFCPDGYVKAWWCQWCLPWHFSVPWFLLGAIYQVGSICVQCLSL